MPSESVVTLGIVLRETDYKESDKILTLLTPEQGKLSVMARGARRKKSPYMAAAQTLVLSEWTLNWKKEWRYAKEGTALELFTGLQSDLASLSLGYYMAELTEAVAPEGEPAQEFMTHLLNGLFALSELHKPAAIVKPAFEWQLMCLAGYAPLADVCAACGKTAPETGWLDTMQGIVRCHNCGTGQKQPARSFQYLNHGAMSALRHCVYGYPKRLYAFSLDGDALEQLTAAAETFLLTHLERSFGTLDFYKRVRDV